MVLADIHMFILYVDYIIREEEIRLKKEREREEKERLEREEEMKLKAQKDAQERERRRQEEMAKYLEEKRQRAMEEERRRKGSNMTQSFLVRKRACVTLDTWWCLFYAVSWCV